MGIGDKGGLQPSTEDLIQLIEMIVMMNNFKFENNNYPQIQGTAMGTGMASLCPNLFIGQSEGHIPAKADKKPTVSWRFIVDMFVIWPQSE